MSPVPVAVIGIGCRLPGGVNSTDQLWKVLAEGREAWSDVPKDRFNWQSFYHPEPEATSGLNHRGGHFLDQDVAAFDAGFFDISPIEAKAMDPQQRIQLEVAYEALENAGIPLKAVAGSNTSVFTAIFNHDYEYMAMKDLSRVPKYLMTGVGAAIASNRISYTFDLKGPSLTLDTGCSGSLVALHQACRSLQSGESDLALTGGTNLILSPDIMIPMSMLSILNDNGKSYPFDSRGSGYGRGEGAAIVVLKRLDDAIKDGDNIRAVIRNTGVAQDGKTNGIMLPSQPAQEDLIRSVYKNAGLDPMETGYIEAHGTGTLAGDRIELGAIRNVFANDVASRGPLYIGSIKANIGHLESSSGVAGLIKAILVLERGQVPPIAGLKDLKKGLNIDGSAIKIPRKLEDWSTSGRRQASVSSFGYGGTNAHVVLEAAPTSHKGHSSALTVQDTSHLSNGHQQLTTNGHHVPLTNGNTHSCKVATVPNGVNGSLADEKEHAVKEKDPNDSLVLPDPKKSDSLFDKQHLQLLTLSAKSKITLLKVMEDMRNWTTYQSENDLDLASLAHSLHSRRTLLPWRYSFVAGTKTDILSSLNPERVPQRESGRRTNTVFLLTGQGAQWFAMGRELIETSVQFRQSLQRSQRILIDLGASWSLLDELAHDKSTSRINASEIGQPSTTAIQIALIDLLHSLGITPHAVLGHSSGEIAAAYAVGALAHEAALTVSYQRGFLAQQSRERLGIRGAMLAVALGEQNVVPYLDLSKADRVVVACSNSPTSTTFAGDVDAIDELSNRLEAASVTAKKLTVDTAYHSHFMNAVAGEYETKMTGIPHTSPTSPTFYYSSVTGHRKYEQFGPSYWAENLVSKVCYTDALQQLCKDLESETPGALNMLVELGPHSALALPTRETLQHMNLDSSFQHLSLLIRNKNGLQTLLTAVGTLIDAGVTVNLEAVNSLDKQTRQLSYIATLPSYPWDHTSLHWHEPRSSREHRLRPHADHDLLGQLVSESKTSEMIWTHVLDTEKMPWLKDHVVDGLAIFPAAAYAAMAIEALKQIACSEGKDKVGSFVLQDVEITKPLIIPDSPKYAEVRTTLRLPLRTDGETLSRREFHISSIDQQGNWTEHCSGYVHVRMVEDLTASDMNAREYEAAQTAEQKRSQRTQCNSQDVKHLYRALEANGNYYGPTFAILEDYALGADTAYGTVVIPDVASVMPANFMQPHIIHPATLDSFIHSGLPLFNDICGQSSIFTSRIGELVVPAKLDSSAGTALDFYTQIRRIGPSATSMDIDAFPRHEEGGLDAAISMKDVHLRGMKKECEEPTTLTQKDATHHMIWNQDLDFCQSSKFKPAQSKGDDSVQALESKLNILNEMAFYYIDKALREIVLSNVVPHHQDHFAWMQKYHASETSRYFANGVFLGSKDQIVLNAEQAGIEGEIMTRVGHNLSTILTGNTDPLALLLEGDGLDRMYQQDSSSQRCYQHMIKYLKLLTFKFPRMRVLEIGAGSGGATLPLVEALGPDGELPFERYTYTDVSTGYMEAAREKFQKWSQVMEFTVLDIGQDPSSQGFTGGDYDLVMTYNALHVTNHIGDALTNARRLLKPDGRLVMIETTSLVPYINFWAGVLPGWYAGVEDGRIDSPLLNVEQWDTELKYNDFRGVELVATDCEGPAQKMSFMVSRTNGPITRSAELPLIKMLPMNAAVAQSRRYQGLSEHLAGSGFQISHESPSQLSLNSNAIYFMLDDKADPIFLRASEDEFKNLASVLNGPSKVFWIAVSDEEKAVQDPRSRVIDGIARTARLENTDLKILTVDVQEQWSQCYEELCFQLTSILQNSFSVSSDNLPTELQYVYQNGQMRIPRLKEIKDEQELPSMKNTDQYEISEVGIGDESHFELDLEQLRHSGQLTLTNTEKTSEPLGPEELELRVEVYGATERGAAAAAAYASTPATKNISNECAGTVVAVGTELHGRFTVGDRVCAWTKGTLASHKRVQGRLAHRIPKATSFADAASVAHDFITAHHALVTVANIKKGDSVLVVEAARGVGQAAVQLARIAGANVYTTARNEEERLLLKDHYGVLDAHIFPAQSAGMIDGVRRMTNGAGVDAVFNTTRGPGWQHSLDCTADLGVFLDASQSVNPLIRVDVPDRGIIFARIDVDAISKQRPEYFNDLFSQVMSSFESGKTFISEPLHTVPAMNLPHAFEFIKKPGFVGKGIIDLKDAHATATKQKKSICRFCSDATYLIAGGLGGIGLEIALFLVDHGAQHLVLVSRRARDREEMKALQDRFAARGAQVHPIACDITVGSDVEALVEQCQNLPPIKGIIQSTMILEDHPLEQMSLQQFNKALEPKVNGTIALADAFARSGLDFFVSLSSCVSIVGNRGQTNYCGGNAYLDALATSSENSATPFITINLGPMAKAGAVAESTSLQNQLQRSGFTTTSMEDLFDVLNKALLPNSGRISTKQVIMGFDRASLGRSEVAEVLQNPLFSSLSARESHKNSDPSNTLRTAVTPLSVADQAVDDRTSLIHSLKRKISVLTGIPEDKIEMSAPIASFGLDSLVSISLRNWISKTCQASLSTDEVMSAKNINALAVAILALSKPAATAEPSNTDKPIAAPQEPQKP